MYASHCFPQVDNSVSDFFESFKQFFENADPAAALVVVSEKKFQVASSRQ